MDLRAAGPFRTTPSRPAAAAGAAVIKHHLGLTAQPLRHISPLNIKHAQWRPALHQPRMPSAAAAGARPPATEAAAGTEVPHPVIASSQRAHALRARLNRSVTSLDKVGRGATIVCRLPTMHYLKCADSNWPSSMKHQSCILDSLHISSGVGSCTCTCMLARGHWQSPPTFEHARIGFAV